MYWRRLKRRAFLEKLGLNVKKSNSLNETPNVMTVGEENYGLGRILTGHPVHRVLKMDL
jgi:hypothetical protein